MIGTGWGSTVSRVAQKHGVSDVAVGHHLKALRRKRLIERVERPDAAEIREWWLRFTYVIHGRHHP